jgi:hypothetical protein
MNFFKLYYLAFSAVFFLSCLKEKTNPPDEYYCPNIISYSVDIQPIINTSCVTNQGTVTECHDAWIFNYDNVVNEIESERLQNMVFQLRTMPQIPNDYSIDSLTEDQIDLMKCWIQQGYPEN